MTGRLRVGTARTAGFFLLWALGILPHLAPSLWLGIAGALVFLWAANALASALRLGGIGGIGLKRHPGWLLHLGVGLLAGTTAVAAYVAAALVAGRYAGIHFRPFAEVAGAALTILLTTAYTGLWEETLCRGYLLRALPRGLGSGALLVLSGVVFAAFHFNRFGSLPSFFLLYWFLSGIAYAVPLLATGSLWTSIGMHWGHNLFYFLFLVRDGWMVAERGSGFWAHDSFVLLVPVLLLAVFRLAAPMVEEAGTWRPVESPGEAAGAAEDVRQEAPVGPMRNRDRSGG